MSYLRKIKPIYTTLLNDIKIAGTFKTQRIISSPQSVLINTDNSQVLNFCANNYLGLSNHPSIIQSSKKTLDEFGFGLSSVRFICGTQTIHKSLQSQISKFHQTEDTILYASCFDANAGFFQALLTKQDAIFTDALNHASIIDGVRLSQAQRHIYRHLDMVHLEQCLQKASQSRIKCIVTDGVFSMDGDFAPLPQICELADKYEAMILIDQCHGTGHIGKTGRGTPEYFGVENRIDVINSTLGKALGGASGGYTTGRKEIIQVLRQKSRPYLFSNSLAPGIVGASLDVLRMLQENSDLPAVLKNNTQRFRMGMKKAGFNVIGFDDSPIAPIMIGDAKLAIDFASDMMEQGIYVIGFTFPVVPKDKARIRVQLSAAHTFEQIDRAVAAFESIGRKRGLIN